MRCFRIAIVICTLCVGASAAEFHVSPAGNDGNAGSEEAPFATLARARDAVRAVKAADGLPDGGLTVWVHAGRYHVADSFALGVEDGGAEGKPIAYRAVSGEEVRLVGGVTLPETAFEILQDEAILERMDLAARPHVMAVDLAAPGVTDLGEFPVSYGDPPLVPELFFNDKRMTLARWPNDGWAEVVKVIESGPAPWRNHESDQPGTFEYDGDRPKRWATAPAVWLHGYWCFDWRSETIQVKEIDTDKRHITFVKPHGYGLGKGNPAPRRYYAENLLEELDAPGEYYIDRDAGALYFWPPAALHEATVVLSTLTDPVVSLHETSHVALEGFTIEACAGTGVEVRGGDHAHVAGCVVRNTGHHGIVVEGGANHRVEGCDIYDTGRAGLRIGGGDRKTLTPSGHEAVDNHIHHVSRRQRTGAYHIHLGGVGVRMAHNLLHDGPHQAIGLQGNDHVIEFNEIHHTGMETDDCGAFYMGRNPSERGSVLRYNFWHHIGSELSHGSCAIYFDDGSGGQKVFGNVFYKAAGGTFGAVFVHGGHDNVVENNIFVECKIAFRQAPWSDERWKEYVAADLWQRKLLEEVDITKPPYSDRYPGLEGFLEPSGEPRLNHAYRNVVVNCDAFVQGNWAIMDNWVMDKDPGFVDPDNLNFQLRDNPYVYKRIPGFEKIPFDQIGPRRDVAPPKRP